MPSFNSRPSCDGRQRTLFRYCFSDWFQFTPVMRRATLQSKNQHHQKQFQFTPVMRRATKHFIYWASSTAFQFTPVMRRATLGVVIVPTALRVSIHARHATGDPQLLLLSHMAAVFQFTPVMRRATVGGDVPLRDAEFQFTPVMRRATASRM